MGGAVIVIENDSAWAAKHADSKDKTVRRAPRAVGYV